MLTMHLPTLALVSALLASAAAKPYTILVTSYDGKITPLSFTPPSTLTAGSAAQNGTLGEHPQWITYSGGLAYVLDTHSPGGRAYVGKYTSGLKKYQGPIPTGGEGPVASTAARDCLFVAHYGSGSATLLPIDATSGKLSPPVKTYDYQTTFAGLGPVTTRQEKAHAHDATASPSKKWVYVADLGADVLHSIRTGKTCADARKAQDIAVPAGSGPRHLTFYGRTAYLASELSCTLTAFAHNDTSGALVPIGEPLQVTPPGTPLGGNQTAGPQRNVAEVAVSPDGKFVYVSARGDEVEDHIAIFKRRSTGSVSWLGWVPSGGRGPRHFSLSANGNWLAVANQDSGIVAVFKRNSQDGSLEKVASVPDLGSIAFAGFTPI